MNFGPAAGFRYSRLCDYGGHMQSQSVHIEKAVRYQLVHVEIQANVVRHLQEQQDKMILAMIEDVRTVG